MRKRWLWAGGAVLVLMVVIAVVGWIMGSSMMRPAQTGPDDLAQIPVGGAVEVVGQIVEIEGNTLRVEVLEGNGYDVFDQRTGKVLSMDQASAEVVMGGPEDVVQGAIAQFEGTKIGPDALTLTRIVILTGYVRGPAD